MTDQPDLGFTPRPDFDPEKRETIAETETCKTELVTGGRWGTRVSYSRKFPEADEPHTGGEGVGHDEAAENALAISKAMNSFGDMLEALKKIAAWEFDIRGDCVADAQKVAREAIEKAEGKQ